MVLASRRQEPSSLGRKTIRSRMNRSVEGIENLVIIAQSGSAHAKAKRSDERGPTRGHTHQTRAIRRDARHERSRSQLDRKASASAR